MTGRRVRNLRDMEKAAKEIQNMGPNVVVTGGHLKGECADLLYDGRNVHHFRAERVATGHSHGTGCVFSSALATLLAMGYGLREAVGKAGEFTRNALKGGYPCGRGAGVVNPKWAC